MLARALPVVLLLGYGIAFGAAALGRGLPVFDDHPGQLYRLQHAIEIGLAPWRWNPGWWAGYPELAFYPPGLSYAGAALHALALGLASPEAIYRVLLWIVLLLPGVTTHALLVRVLGNGWLALPGAFLALTISAETRSGLEEGLRWGLVAARLGWSLLPLLGLSLWRPLDRASPAAPLLLAAVIITHPAHAPGACAMALVAAGLAPVPVEARMHRALWTVGLGLALAGFWLVPLLAHLQMTLPLTWGDATLGGLSRRLVHYPVLSLLLVANAAAWFGHLRRPEPDRALSWLLALGPVSVALVAADALLALLGMHWLPADRVADTAVLCLILGAAAGLAEAARVTPRLPAWSLGLGAVAVLLALAPGGDEPGLSLWPSARQWPPYEEVVRGTRLADLWQALREAPPGRVLFVRSSVPLEYGREWWRPHSHITALTPSRAGRAIVNGTFTHPSPVAGFVYRGSPTAPITTLVERRDGVTLFGRPLEGIRPAWFDGVAAALRISAVVALDEDAGRLGFVADHPDFGPPRRIGPFLLFTAKPSRAVPAPPAADGAEIAVPPLPPGGAMPRPAWLETGVAYSPLWRAWTGGGALATRQGGLGLLEVARPADGTPMVRVRYGPGPAEWIGLAVSALAAVTLAGGARRGRYTIGS